MASRRLNERLAKYNHMYDDESGTVTSEADQADSVEDNRQENGTALASVDNMSEDKSNNNIIEPEQIPVRKITESVSPPLQMQGSQQKLHANGELHSTTNDNSLVLSTNGDASNANHVSHVYTSSTCKVLPGCSLLFLHVCSVCLLVPVCYIVSGVWCVFLVLLCLYNNMSCSLFANVVITVFST